MKKLIKSEARKQVQEFFSNIKNKSPKQLKKIKRLAMNNNIPLKESRKLFCKKCYIVFNQNNSKIRIKKGKKIVACLNCNYISRWKL
ncbi:hypothetical protein CMI39_02115 [Candidatus Pacearchaeota archaeon]|jgi:RNase P subunit RPR2|nr:hypothetical protein [Candidatus Pacearchaeota archaeon]